MVVHSPLYPGKFIQAACLDPLGLSGRHLAEKLHIAASTLNRIPRQQSGVSPEMALRLSAVLGRSPESWLAMQDAHDLWAAIKTVQLNGIQKPDLRAMSQRVADA